MPKIVTKHPFETVFVGPSSPNGNYFITESGDFVNYTGIFYTGGARINDIFGPIVYWPDIGVGNYAYTRCNVTSGLFWEGESNVIKMVADTQSGFHGMFVRFPGIISGGGPSTSGIYKIEGKIYLPTSNTITNRINYNKNGSSFAITVLSGNRWQYFSTNVLMGVNDGTTSNDNIGLLLLNNANAQYSGNNSDPVYFKDLKITNISGYRFFNLIQPLQRIQSISYDINVPSQKVVEIGKRGLVENAIIEHPTINLSLEYIQNDLSNEQKIGFDLNYPQFFSGQNGQSRYTGFNYNILSGFLSRQYLEQTNYHDPTFVHYNDKKNIFISVAKEEVSVNNDIINDDYYYSGMNTVGFGNCYLNSYSVQGGLGQFPTCQLNYLCENVTVYEGNNGILPTLTPKDAGQQTGRYFIIPRYTGLNAISVINPLDTDIIIENTGYNGAVYARDFGSSVPGLKFQGYDFEVPLNRVPLTSVGYKLPINRKITFPVISTLNINAVVEGDSVGSIHNLFDYENPYNISIKLNNKCDVTGPDSYKNTLIQYDFIGSRLRNVSYGNSIGRLKTVTLSFEQEINPDKTNLGLYMSGVVFGRTLLTTGTINHLPLYSTQFLHRSGNLNYFNALV